MMRGAGIGFILLVAAGDCPLGGTNEPQPPPARTLRGSPAQDVLESQPGTLCETSGSALPADTSLTAVQIAVGSETSCARLKSGGVRCWGSNAHGELASCSDASTVSIPVAFPEVTNAVDVAVGALGTCVVTRDGRVACSHGVRATLGAEGPGWIDGIPPATATAVGGRHVCVLGGDRSVLCFGRADAVEALGSRFVTAGDGRTAKAAGYVDIQGTRALTAGASHSCAVDGQGAVYCWGANTLGQLGDPGAPASLDDNPGTPRRVGGLPFIEAIDTGTDTTCATSEAGELFCWGAGFGPATLVPVASVTGTGVGEGFVCASDRGGSLGCIGTGIPWAESGIRLSGFENITELAVGAAHVCGRRSDGVVLCQGATSKGRLGSGPSTNDATIDGPETYAAKAQPVLLAGTSL